MRFGANIYIRFPSPELAQTKNTPKMTKALYISLLQDNSKAFVVLEYLESDESPDECGRRAVDFLLGLDIFQ